MLDRKAGADVLSKLVQAERKAMESQLMDLRAELKEYDKPRSTGTAAISLGSFEEPVGGLIKAKIAGGLSQRVPAGRLKLKEQQVQRYEAKRYASASFQRLCEVTRPLRLGMESEILLVSPLAAESPPDRILPRERIRRAAGTALLTPPRSRGIKRDHPAVDGGPWTLTEKGKKGAGVGRFVGGIARANGPQLDAMARFGGRSAPDRGGSGGSDRESGNSELAAGPRERTPGGRATIRRARRAGRSCPRCA